MADLSQKVIVTVAPTGSIPTRKDNPALPITPDEIADETARSYSAGASVVHLHARDPNSGEPSSRPELYGQYLERIRAKCPIVTQITTGGGAVTMGLSPEERLAAVKLYKPESASLNAGSMNFGRKLFPNTPEIMEAFADRFREWGVLPEFEVYDAGMIQNAKHWLIEPGKVKAPYRFSLVLGVMGGIPPTAKHLCVLVEDLPKESVWQVIGIGRHQLPLGAVAVGMGGGLRVGFEDNVYLKKGVLAKSNAELVAQAVQLVRAVGKEPATPDEAREILGIGKK
jgi:3-keto-5-aminohexanoate cleavage enzyme